jgi:hypothetical protein
MKIKNRDDELKPDGIRLRASDEPKQDEEKDAEGHMFQPDLGTSRHLAKSRSAEIEREMRDRQRQKEARPNRR